MLQWWYQSQINITQRPMKGEWRYQQPLIEMMSRIPKTISKLEHLPSPLDEKLWLCPWQPLERLQLGWISINVPKTFGWFAISAENCTWALRRYVREAFNGGGRAQPTLHRFVTACVSQFWITNSPRYRTDYEHLRLGRFTCEHTHEIFATIAPARARARALDAQIWSIGS